MLGLSHQGNYLANRIQQPSLLFQSYTWVKAERILGKLSLSISDEVGSGGNHEVFCTKLIRLCCLSTVTKYKSGKVSVLQTANQMCLDIWHQKVCCILLSLFQQIFAIRMSCSIYLKFEVAIKIALVYFWMRHDLKRSPMT